ncbi:MAG TPA: hypothetical protein VG621_02750 [Candidatus Paceibacterota bacterium]|nr:hypothetical protein [Candidatus Paceibacterota bacterium]
MKAAKPTKSKATIDTVSDAIAELSRVVDKLALSTAKGFSETASQHSVNRIESRLDDIEFRIGKIESNHERRLDIVEDKIRILSTAFEKQLKIKLPK